MRLPKMSSRPRAIPAFSVDTNAWRTILWGKRRPSPPSWKNFYLARRKSLGSHRYFWRHTPECGGNDDLLSLMGGENVLFLSEPGAADALPI